MTREHMVRLVATALATVLFWPVCVRGAELISLERAVQLASKSPRILASQAEVERVKADFRTATGMFFPAATASHQYGWTNDPVGVFGAKLQQGIFTQNDFQLPGLNNPSTIGHSVTRFELAQPLLHSLRDIKNHSAAAKALEAQQWQHDFVVQKIRLQTMNHYYAAVALAKQKEVVQEGIDRLKALEKSYQVMQAPTSATTTSYLIAQSVRLELEAQLAGLGAERTSALVALAALIGLPAGKGLELSDALPTVVPLDKKPATPDNEGEKQPVRPDIHAAAVRKQAAKAALTAAKSTWGPDLDLVAGFNIYTGDYDVAETAYDVGLLLSWPFFRAPRIGQVQAAKAGLSAAQEMERAANLEMKARQESIERALEASISAYGLVKQAAERAVKANRLAKRRYREGSLPLFDLSRSIQQWVRVEMNLLSAQRQVAHLSARRGFERGEL